MIHSFITDVPPFPSPYPPGQRGPWELTPAVNTSFLSLTYSFCLILELLCEERQKTFMTYNYFLLLSFPLSLSALIPKTKCTSSTYYVPDYAQQPYKADKENLCERNEMDTGEVHIQENHTGCGRARIQTQFRALLLTTVPPVPLLPFNCQVTAIL